MIRHCRLAIATTLLVLIACVPAVAVAADVKIEPAGGLRVHVGPGECAIGEKTLTAAATALEIEPVTIERVSGEKIVVTSDAPRGWAKGTPLEQCRSAGMTLPGGMTPGAGCPAY